MCQWSSGLIRVGESRRKRICRRLNPSNKLGWSMPDALVGLLGDGMQSLERCVEPPATSRRWIWSRRHTSS
jgi:hypothetical protein